MPDGTQQMLHSETHELIRTFAKNPKTGVPAHYIKQKNEKVALCPGAPEAMAKLFLLMELRYAQHLKYNRIAWKLNDEGIPSVLNGQWTAASVRTILLNPIYVGLGIRYRRTRGIYVMGGSADGEPEPSEVTPQELDENPHVRLRRRDRSKWKERAEDHLKDFLPEHVRDAARAAVLHHLDLIADGKPLRVVNRDRHAQSLYLLKNVLFCKETSLPMKGRLSGDKGKEVRKYGISKGARIPRSDAPSQKCVRAEPAERAVMELVRTAVLDRPRMTEAMAKVLSLAEREKKSDGDVAKMQRQVKRLRNQIAVLSDDVSDEEHGGDDPVVQKIARVRREIDRLIIAIRQAGATPSAKPHDPREAMERLARELAEAARSTRRTSR